MNIEQNMNPELLTLFRTLQPGTGFPATADLPNARKLQTENLGRPPHGYFDEVVITEHAIAGPEGSPELIVRIYLPSNHSPQEVLPGLMWIHGGGFVVGSPRENDIFCLSFAETARCVVVSPDYRLAPENPFPAGVEDCYVTLKWLAEGGGKELGIDVARLAVGGFSAGGGLAAAVALLARDRGGPALVLQMPLSACLDNRNLTQSSQEITDGRTWNRQISIQAWELYLNGNNAEEVSAYAAPARCQDLSNLPPTYMGVGELDLVRDENVEYALRLMHAGVPTELHVIPGAYHGFELMAVNSAAIADLALSEYGRVLKAAFSRRIR